MQQLHSVAVLYRVGLSTLIPQNMRDPFLVVGVLTNLLKYFNFIVGSFLVVTSGLLDFKSHVGVIGCVPREPNCAEVAPA
jgi:hypothetical protein